MSKKRNDNNKIDKADKTNKVNKANKTDKTNKVNKVNKADNIDKKQQVEKIDKTKKEEKIDKTKKEEKIDKTKKYSIENLLEKITKDAVTGAIVEYKWLVAKTIAAHIIGTIVWDRLSIEDQDILIKKVNEIKLKANAMVLMK